ncbi:hypothetical protein GUJ93_ZPchr0010g10396 [Zizania palustris]|uniref:Uncharacterized protein n=1 Tax=Zizania palustris TaxID=103762 RepID=A0A8J6BL68_ZIZPA|nr:hypothetical protein GUJ93_ZPchr0010g10396 [Zizania palustris]
MWCGESETSARDLYTGSYSDGPMVDISPVPYYKMLGSRSQKDRGGSLVQASETRRDCKDTNPQEGELENS